MAQHFEAFSGTPDKLVVRLEALKTLTKTIVQVIESSMKTVYIIIYTD